MIRIVCLPKKYANLFILNFYSVLYISLIISLTYRLNYIYNTIPLDFYHSLFLDFNPQRFGGLLEPAEFILGLCGF